MSKSKKKKALAAPKQGKFNTWDVITDGVTQKHRWNSDKIIVEKLLMNSVDTWIPAYSSQPKVKTYPIKSNAPYTSAGTGKKWTSKPQPYKGPY